MRIIYGYTKRSISAREVVGISLDYQYMYIKKIEYGQFKHDFVLTYGETILNRIKIQFLAQEPVSFLFLVDNFNDSFCMFTLSFII